MRLVGQDGSGPPRVLESVLCAGCEVSIAKLLTGRGRTRAVRSGGGIGLHDLVALGLMGLVLLVPPLATERT